MQSILSLLVLISVIAVVESQTWPGIYTVEPGCDTSTCCCPTGRVTVTRSGNSLNLYGDLTGRCKGVFAFDGNVPYPDGFQTLVQLFESLSPLTLSPDSHTITLNDLKYPQCNVKAVKNGALKEPMNVGLLLIALVLLPLIVYPAKN